MCQLVEDYANAKALEREKATEIKNATNFLLNGVSVEVVAKSIPSLSLEFIQELSSQITKGKKPSAI